MDKKLHFLDLKNEKIMSKKKKIDNKLSTFTSAILSHFAEEPFRPKNYKQVCKYHLFQEKPKPHFCYC